MLISAVAYYHFTVNSNKPHHHLQTGTQLAPVHNTAPVQAHGPFELRPMLDA